MNKKLYIVDNIPVTINISPILEQKQSSQIYQREISPIFSYSNSAFNE
jgi:hypothetical protein